MKYILTFLILLFSFGLTNAQTTDTFEGKPKWTLDLRKLPSGTYDIKIQTNKFGNPAYSIKKKTPIDKPKK
jgi:hypothetical protein